MIKVVVLVKILFIKLFVNTLTSYDAIDLVFVNHDRAPCLDSKASTFSWSPNV